jgi:hypothetical protein
MEARRPLEGVLYKISPTLAAQRSRLVQALEANGAKEAKSMSEATHVLTDSLVFEGSESAQENALVIVRPVTHPRYLLADDAHCRRLGWKDR